MKMQIMTSVRFPRGLALGACVPLAAVKAPGVPKNPAVTNVRLGKLDGRTRVVIDLTGPGKIRHILSKDRKRLDVRIDR